MNSLFDPFELQEDFLAAGIIIYILVTSIQTAGDCGYQLVISDTASSENHSKNSCFFLATARSIEQPLAKIFSQEAVDVARRALSRPV